MKSSFVIAILFFASAFAAMGQGRSMITGFVTDDDKRPIERARVELTDESTYSVRRTETDKSGRFTFTNLNRGRYSVRVLVPGSVLAEQTQSVEISGGGRSGTDTEQLDFRLRPRSTSAAMTASVIFAQDVPPEAKRAYDSALSELKRDNPQVAVNDLIKAIEFFPTYFAALETLGVEYMKRQMFEDAVKAFEISSKVNPKSYHSWYGLGYALFGLEKNEAALEAAKKAIELDRASAPAYFIIGMVQRRLKAYTESEKAFLKAKDLDNEQKTPDIHWNLALLYAHNLQKYGKAADELELFLKATPDNPDTANIKKLISNFRSKQ